MKRIYFIHCFTLFQTAVFLFDLNIYTFKISINYSRKYSLFREIKIKLIQQNNFYFVQWVLSSADDELETEEFDLDEVLTECSVKTRDQDAKFWFSETFKN